MIKLRPDNCHPANFIGFKVPNMTAQRPVRALPRNPQVEVNFFEGVFTPNRERLLLKPSEELELFIILMGLTTERVASIFRKDPVMLAASEQSLLERLGIEKRHEVPTHVFDSKQIRIVTPAPFPIPLSEQERKIVTYLSTGLTGDEISTVLEMDGEVLEKTVEQLADRSGIHTVEGIKTMGWLSGMAIGSMQCRFPQPDEEALPSLPLQQPLPLARSLA